VLLLVLVQTVFYRSFLLLLQNAFQVFLPTKPNLLALARPEMASLTV
jgi:hypothetical protein